METSEPFPNTTSSAKAPGSSSNKHNPGDRSNPPPWYKNISTFISVIALVFSFITTYVSYRRDSEQDIQSLRSELRIILQRLSALPKENLEAYNKYKDDPGSFNLVSGFIAQENNLLSKQAESTVSRLPATNVSSTDFYAVAIALQNARYFDKAATLYSQAINKALGLDDEVGPLRALAALQFAIGKVGEGRTNFQKAVDIFSKYPGFDSNTIATTNVLTELSWANSEAANGFLNEVHQHLNRAEQHASVAPVGPSGRTLLTAQVDQARKQIFSGNQTILPTSIQSGLPTQQSTGR